jgi:hypothetical protein
MSRRANRRREDSAGHAVNLGREVMAMQDPLRQPIPIRQRRVDLLFVAIFLLNFAFTPTWWILSSW